jgi:hypothetical protein
MRILAHSYFFLSMIFCFAFPSRTFAQSPVSDTAIRASAINNAVLQYRRFTLPPTALYNGPEYVDYLRTLQEGHPFFASPQFDTGAVVMYDNMLYEAMKLKFDLVKNELVTIDPSKVFTMTLFHDKINYFIIHGHTFIRIMKDSSDHSLATGFYDRLYQGRSLTLLKKEQKKIMTYVNERDGIRNVIEVSQDFYINITNGYYRTNNKNAVLKLLTDKRSELKQYIRKSKLSFSKGEVEKTLISIVSYYDSLKK